MKTRKNLTTSEWYDLAAESWDLWLKIINKYYNLQITPPKAKQVAEKVYSRYGRRMKGFKESLNDR